ncbi:MAG TPA: glycosyl hydrolase 108 family protein [Acidocella sp.]|nr:glycosyl hydrolase 108 family protein [Acidocella sp.]
MIGNQLACDAFTAAEEGGYTNNPSDPGNWTGGACGVGACAGTKYGIAASQHPTLDIAALTPAQAAHLRAPYWTAINGNELPKGLDLVAYDFGVNAGPCHSAKLLQGVLGVSEDGSIGPGTLAAIAAHDVRQLIASLSAAHVAYYQGLPTFAEFGGGWVDRVQRCQAAALAMLEPVAA